MRADVRVRDGEVKACARTAPAVAAILSQAAPEGAWTAEEAGRWLLRREVDMVISLG
jgi:hypothetical protein